MSAGQGRFFGFRRLLAGAVALVGIATGAMTYTVWMLRADAIESAYEHTGNLANVLSEQISQTFRTIDLLIDDINDRIQSWDITSPEQFRTALAQPRGHDLLRRTRERLPQADMITLVDAKGRLVATSRTWPASMMDLSDREYVRHFTQDGGQEGTYISLPQDNRMTGVRTIFFARAVRNERSELVGLIVVGVPLAALQAIYEGVGAVSNHGFMLARTTGEILVRHPDEERVAGTLVPPGSPWFAVAQAGGGRFRSEGTFSPGARLVSVRAVPDSTLVVSVGVLEASALAGWKQRGMFIVGGAGLLFVCAAVLLAAIARGIRDLSASRQSLAERSRELRVAKGQLDAAINNISQGISMFDSEQRLVLCNTRYLEIYGLSPEVVKPGCTFRDILEYRRSARSFYSTSTEQLVEVSKANVLAGKRFSHTTKLADGRVIEVVANPTFDRGWVATHEDITERHQAESMIMHMATHDALTDLWNRSAFETKLKDALDQFHGTREKAALLILDLDKFKSVNDTMGHLAGDALLREVADRLRQSMTDNVAGARLGGDEFALVATGLMDPEDSARRLANRILDAMRVPVKLGAGPISVSLSIGIALVPRDGSTVDDLMRRADLALYRAKDEGRNRLRFYDRAVDEADDKNWSRRAG